LSIPSITSAVSVTLLLRQKLSWALSHRPSVRL
jgi:hypothetical protein